LSLFFGAIGTSQNPIPNGTIGKEMMRGFAVINHLSSVRRKWL
jgi:hypothetical protein